MQGQRSQQNELTNKITTFFHVCLLLIKGENRVTIFQLKRALGLELRGVSFQTVSNATVIFLLGVKAQPRSKEQIFNLCLKFHFEWE